MIAYILMVAVTFALLLYWNRRFAFTGSISPFDEGAFVIMFFVMALIWPVILPIGIIVVGTRRLMHYLMRGND